jgi:hypothetical protein
MKITADPSPLANLSPLDRLIKRIQGVIPTIMKKVLK